MIVKAIFEDGNEVVTRINCSLPEAEAYYIGNSFEFVVDGEEVSARCVELELVTN